ncbi:hypothetical protein OIU79_006300 [Salix purpurea]|uniref:Uncharacterized protein n=1 Tax=Salix purpurea TaxID=77065 RepID=A0A9Q0Z1W0_SALPP|nr:hypothetical protein OIU79_006300 [Salix purpurea]
MFHEQETPPLQPIGMQYPTLICMCFRIRYVDLVFHAVCYPAFNLRSQFVVCTV